MWTIRIDLNDTEDSWFYSTNNINKPTIEEIILLIHGDIKIERIYGICVYQEQYYDLSEYKSTEASLTCKL